MARISGNQAALTGYLVKWSAENKDPKIKALAPQYRVYDADTKRKAAAKQPDKAKREQALKEALAAYQAIKQQPGNDVPTDTTAGVGIGFCQFDLGNYDDAAKALGALIRDGRLGGPLLTEPDKTTGEVRVRDNDIFWEAMYKWLRSKAELAKANGPDAADLRKSAQDTLKSQFITNGARTGGDKWKDEFEALRKDLLPDWTPGAAPAGARPAAPASQPTAPTPPVAAK